LCQPAVNEELGATAIAGTQQIAQTTGARSRWHIFAGVWKRSRRPTGRRCAAPMEIFRDRRHMGASCSPSADDHVAKSSSIVCYSTKWCGGLQCRSSILGSRRGLSPTAFTASLCRGTRDPCRAQIITESRIRRAPSSTGRIGRQSDPAGNRRSGDRAAQSLAESPLEQESRQIQLPTTGIAAYVRANGPGQGWCASSRRARIGLVAAGKSWLDLLDGAHGVCGLDSTRTGGRPLGSRPCQAALDLDQLGTHKG